MMNINEVQSKHTMLRCTREWSSISFTPHVYL